MLSRAALRRLMAQAAGAGSLDAVYHAALRCVQEGLGVERASLLLFDDACTIHFVAWSGLSDEYRTAVDGHTPWSPDETDATPLLVADVERDASLDAYVEVFRREDIRALAFVPLQFGARLLGKFMLYYRTPHTFSDEEIATAQQIADQVALALEHHRISVALEAQLVAERQARQHAESEAEHRQASEQRLHLALAAGRMGTWDWDIRSGRVSWSAEVESIHGLEPGTFGGTLDAFRRDVHPLDLQRVQRTIVEALEAPDEDYTIEYRIVRADGTIRWLEARGRVLVGDQGVPARMVGVCCDATERRRAEDAKALLVAQLETLAQVSDQIAGALDPTEALQKLAWRVVPAFADYCVTYIADEMLILPVGCAHRDPARNALVAALAHSAPVSVDDQWGPGKVIGSGEPRLVTDVTPNLSQPAAADLPLHPAHRALNTRSVMIVPLIARGHTLGAIAFASTDDSGRRFGQEELKIAGELASRAALLVDNARLYAEAKAAIRQRDDMMAVVSHDLREPLQSISMAAALLRPAQEHAASAESLQSITLASTQMRYLLQDLLDVSRIDAGQFSISREGVELTALVQEAQMLCQSRAQARGVRLESTVAVDLPAVTADRHRVLQVLLNLIGNALKFVPAGGAITLGTERQADAIRVWVADTGVGIADDQLPRVFDRFWRAEGRAGGGVGLGLSVAKAIVEAHGGQIGVTSRLGVGSTFFFTLPLSSAADPLRSSASEDRVDTLALQWPRIEKSRIALADVLQAAVLQCREVMERADHELSLALPQEPVFLHADPARLGQVFTSVLSNAARYTPRGGRINVMAERVGAGVRVSVQDNGIGILPDKLRQIFESSNRDDASVETDQTGCRSGLPLVKALVELHGGTVMARSDGLGKGSVFTVWLPSVVGADASTPASVPRGSDVGGLRVLLVDDNRELSQAMTRFIRTLGYEVFVAFDGARAVQLASEVRPQVALMDLGLPDRTGYEVAREIRMQPWGTMMTLVAITGQVKERQRSYEAGFDLHLTKPVDPGVLEAFLATCLSHPRTADSAS